MDHFKVAIFICSFYFFANVLGDRLFSEDEKSQCLNIINKHKNKKIPDEVIEKMPGKTKVVVAAFNKVDENADGQFDKIEVESAFNELKKHVELGDLTYIRDALRPLTYEADDKICYKQILETFAPNEEDVPITQEEKNQCLEIIKKYEGQTIPGSAIDEMPGKAKDVVNAFNNVDKNGEHKFKKRQVLSALNKLQEFKNVNKIKASLIALLNGDDDLVNYSLVLEKFCPYIRPAPITEDEKEECLEIIKQYKGEKIPKDAIDKMPGKTKVIVTAFNDIDEGADHKFNRQEVNNALNKLDHLINFKISQASLQGLTAEVDSCIGYCQVISAFTDTTMNSI